MSVDAAKLQGRYCNSLTQYSRFITREVFIGDVPMGGNNPIRIQSMTTTDTMDTMGTVEQSIRMIEAGCEYIRITAPSIKEAQNLAAIKKELPKKIPHIFISAVAQQGLVELKDLLWEVLNKKQDA